MSTDRTTDPARRGVMARLRAGLMRFARNSEGSTAIEFTALAIPFSLLVFAILESCISFAAQEVLANATDDIARQLRTGQLRAADVTETSLKKLICDRLEIVAAAGCPGLRVDLRSFATFTLAADVDIKLTGTYGQKEIDGSDFAVAPGNALTKNMLRVFYPWPVVTDLISSSMSELKDGKTLLFASVTWQNEPFDD